ncbi:hypothetical protein MPER_02596, partial [Moniliophthora perniciosa FA553]
ETVNAHDSEFELDITTHLLLDHYCLPVLTLPTYDSNSSSCPLINIMFNVIGDDILSISVSDDSGDGGGRTAIAPLIHPLLVTGRPADSPKPVINLMISRKL